MWQCCPLCKKEVPPVERFPYYLCNGCRRYLTDRNGNPVVFRFAANPFGYKGEYKNDPSRAYLYDLCYIGKEEFRVYSDGKNDCFIQPVDFSKYASRPSILKNAPQDPVSFQESLPDPKEKLNNKATFLHLFISFLPLLAGTALLELLKLKILTDSGIAVVIYLLLNCILFFRVFITKINIFYFSGRSFSAFPVSVILFFFFFLIGLMFFLI